MEAFFAACGACVSQPDFCAAQLNHHTCLTEWALKACITTVFVYYTAVFDSLLLFFLQFPLLVKRTTILNLKSFLYLIVALSDSTCDVLLSKTK